MSPGDAKMELPKLYRPVYARIEWIEDSNYGGIAHKQEGGEFSIKIKRVSSNEGMPIFIACEELDKEDSKVMDFLIELNCEPEPYWFEWSSKPFKHVPASYDLHYYK